MNAFCARKSAYVPHFNMLFSLGQLAVFLHICALTITERMPENPHGFFLLFSSLSGIQWPKCMEFQASVKNTKNIQDFYISFKYLYVFEYTGLESLYLKHPAANQKWAINSESVEKLSFCCVIHLSQKECQQRNITPKKIYTEACGFLQLSNECYQVENTFELKSSTNLSHSLWSLGSFFWKTFDHFPALSMQLLLILQIMGANQTNYLENLYRY